VDFSRKGRPDLLIGCLKGPNRYFRNQGNGKFVDATDEIGLGKRIFNTRGVFAVDLGRHGVPDVIFNNEGQDPVVLVGNPTWGAQ
jgi:hypothetical protein